MKSSLATSPPLQVWVAVLVLVLAFFGLAYVAIDRGPMKDSMGDGNVAKEWQKERSGKPLVISVGSSLLLEAVDRRRVGDDASSYQFLAFYRPSATYENFGSFFGPPLAARPRLLLLHSDLLLQDTPGAEDFLGTLRSAIGSTVRKALGKPPEPMKEDHVCQQVSAAALMRARRYQAKAYQRRPDEHGLLDWIARQRAAGVAVVLLDIPRSTLTERQIGEPLARWRHDLDALAATGIPVLRYAGPLQESDFCDGSHMAAEGRTRYTDWLRQNIQRLLHEPG